MVVKIRNLNDLLTIGLLQQRLLTCWAQNVSSCCEIQ